MLQAPLAESSPALLELARKLKTDVLGQLEEMEKDRLIPQESAIHLDEMAEIQRQRAVLAVPISPEAHVRARLAIARAYLELSMKEREAALELIQRHGLGASFTQELGALRTAFDRELTREQRLLGAWHAGAADLLTEAARRGVDRVAAAARLDQQERVRRAVPREPGHGIEALERTDRTRPAAADRQGPEHALPAVPLTPVRRVRSAPAGFACVAG